MTLGGDLKQWDRKGLEACAVDQKHLDETTLGCSRPLVRCVIPDSLRGVAKHFENPLNISPKKRNSVGKKKC